MDLTIKKKKREKVCLETVSGSTCKGLKVATPS